MRHDEGLINTPLGFVLTPLLLALIVVVLLVLSPVVWFGDQYLAWRRAKEGGA